MVVLSTIRLIYLTRHADCYDGTNQIHGPDRGVDGNCKRSRNDDDRQGQDDLTDGKQQKLEAELHAEQLAGLQRLCCSSLCRQDVERAEKRSQYTQAGRNVAQVEKAHRGCELFAAG
ncbi:hypothetical protein PG991_009024 [Apiospora marii]|uniref:Uncharacterized protein n=1 Tax=Apiospora marii TaxID=335849 RepID=A0ABR1RKT0_9PEZI